MLVPKNLFVLFVAESERTRFINILSLVEGVTHEVSRANIFESVTTLFKSEYETIVNEIPLRIRFRGERAIDDGGVSRDMFSSFFEAIYAKYFDGASLLCPVVNPHTKQSDLRLIGLICSCAYLSSGVLPLRIAFPCLSAMLLPNRSKLPDHIFIDSLKNSVSVHDAFVIEDAFQRVQLNESSFSQSVQTRLVNVLSNFDCRELLNPQNFQRMIIDIAIYHFLRKPSAVIADIQSGVPSVHLPFWKGVDCASFYTLYKAMQATPAKVLEMISNVTTSDSREEKVLSYLRQFIGNMRHDEVQHFLRFVTGSPVCSSKSLLVTFNKQEGLLRRPISHTCSNTLELSSNYESYAEFTEEMSSVLCNPDGLLWTMDAY